MPIEQPRTALPGKSVSSTPVSMFARIETYALLLAMFILISGGAYLSPEMQNKAEGNGTLVSTEAPGPMHLVQWAIAFGIIFLIVISRWRSVVNMSLRMKILSSTVLFATSSFLWSVDPPLSLRSGIYLLFNMSLVFYLVQRFSLQEMMRFFIALGVGVAVLSFATAILLPSYAWTRVGSRQALQGVFVAKNLLGNNAVLLLTPALFIRSMRRTARLVYVSGLSALIVLSFSVQAWAAALFCFSFAVIGILFRRLRSKDAIWIAYITVLPLLFAIITLLTNWLEILQFLGKDPTISGRTTIWGAVLEAVMKRPVLGWGYNAFWQGLQGESGRVLVIIHFPIAQAQNGLLELLLGIGAVGVLTVLATFVQAFRNIVRCFRSGAFEAANWYLLIVLVTIYYSIGEANLLIPNTLQWMMYMTACVGLSTEATRKLGTRPPEWLGSE